MKKIIAGAVLAGLLTVASQQASAATTDFGMLGMSASESFGDTFTSAVSSFTDDYTFKTAPAGSFNAFAASFNLADLSGIDNLVVSLFITNGSTVTQVFGVPVSAGGFDGEAAVIDTLMLKANTNYTLEVTGDVTGTQSGFYSGGFNFSAPVPEPETYALMLAGLGMLGWVASRRRKDA